MSGVSKIEWTDATWNPITGCSVVSPGCTNCYAMRLAGTRLKHTEVYRGLTYMVNGKPVWNGTVKLAADRTLTAPLRWRKPRRIFVCSMSDLFHEAVSDEWLPRVFGIMAATPQHHYQVLTKRPRRMNEVVSDPAFYDAVEQDCRHALHHRFLDGMQWPLPNVWVGTSIEDQVRADERIPWLLNTPAAVRFLSCEPLLGPIDLTRLDLGIKQTHGYGDRRIYWDALTGWEHQCAPSKRLTAGEHGRTAISGPHRRMQWIIVGGESGPGARPMELAWARSIRDQCREANVPVFIKQLGARPREICTSPKQVPVNLETIGVWVEGMSETRQAKVLSRDGHRYTVEWPLRDPKGGDMAEWPIDLRIREHPDG